MLKYQLLSNEDLLARYQAAEFSAFDIFYRRNERLIFHFLLARLGNRPDAEEAFQETFLRLHGALHRYDPSQSAMAWVLTIARNAAIDTLRRRHRSRPTAPEDFASLPAGGVAADAALEAREALDVILQDLSAGERTLIEARLLGEESYEEIASKTGTNPAQVRQRLSRLLRRLRG